MMRFKDPTLLRILHTMRTVGGKPLSRSDWQALVNTEAGDQSCDAGWYHTCYVWSVIAMASFMEARESTRKSQKTLCYVQAVDVFQNFTPPDRTAAQNLHDALLKVPSLTKTKRLPAFCLLHVGMEVRLTTTLDMPYAVQKLQQLLSRYSSQSTMPSLSNTCELLYHILKYSWSSFRLLS